MTIGHYIREARQRNGLTIEQVVGLVPMLASMDDRAKGSGAAYLALGERDLVQLVPMLRQLKDVLGPIGPPTRLELSALDHAIACLARGQRAESLDHLRRWVSADAYSRAVEMVAEEENRRRGAVGLDAWPSCLAYARRIVRARLALYLRLVRRQMAWECYERPFSEQCRPDPRVTWARIVWRPDTWRPLWLDAPTHDPSVSPRQRRGAT